jgi:hypothetical protein
MLIKKAAIAIITTIPMIVPESFIIRFFELIGFQCTQMRVTS